MPKAKKAPAKAKSSKKAARSYNDKRVAKNIQSDWLSKLETTFICLTLFMLVVVGLGMVHQSWAATIK